MNNHRVPSNSTPNSARAPKLLKFAEYASLAASVVGTIASATSQQIVYAAAPITVSLALNLANRQRFEQQTQQRITAAINQVDGSIQQLEQRIAQLQEQLTTALDQHAAGLEETAASQNEQTAAALAEFTVKPTELSQQFEQEFQAIRRQLQAQPESINPARIQGIEQSLEQLRRQVAEFTETAQFRPPESNLAALEVVRQSIDLLVARIASLG